SLRRAGGGQVDAQPPRAEPRSVTRYHKIGHAPAAIEGLFVTLFLEAYKTPLQEIILDLDATDDPLHEDQEGGSPHKPPSDNRRQNAPHTAYRATKPGCVRVPDDRDHQFQA